MKRAYTIVRMLLFLGLGSCFTYSASAQTWTQLSPTGEPTPGRFDHSAVYDATTNTMVVFAGDTAGGATSLNDTWLLTFADGLGGTPNWAPLSTTGGPPSVRFGHSAVYDDGTNQMVVFGGSFAGSNCGQAFNDTWSLSNANGSGGTPTWTLLLPVGTPPPSRANHTAVYNPNTNRMIVFAGSPGCVNYSDVWVLENANGIGGQPTWTQLFPAGGPPTARYGHSAVYDVADNRMIVFGGQLDGQPHWGSDVWVLTNADGTGGSPNWILLSPSGPLPNPRAFHAAVYDSNTNLMTIFGGLNSDITPTGFNDVWVLSNANGLGGSPAWTQLSPAGTLPHTRGFHTAVYHTPGSRMIVFGGLSDTTLNDTWVLEPNSVPTAANVNITGTPNVGELLTGHYTYADADGDLEGTSTFRWLRDGTTTVGTSNTYTPVVADVNHTITFEVTPVAATGASPGLPATSAGVTVHQAAAITSANSATFVVGALGSFNVTSTGFPTPALSELGTLPSGVSFIDNGNGTGTLNGTPALGTAGTYNITFTASNGVGPDAVQNFTLTVIALQSISVTPVALSLAKGLTLQFAATGTYTDASTRDLTNSVTWASSKPSVATISASGLASGVVQGTATITATSGSISGSTLLTVMAPALSSISVTPVNQSIATGTTKQFTAQGTYSDGSTKTITSTVTWTSSNPSVATIDSLGVATGVAAGGTTITATLGSISGATTLTVQPALVSIAITPVNASVAVSGSLQFTATGTYSDSSTQDLTASVTWTTNKPAVATISASGLATAVAKGIATIKAKLGGITNNTTLTVTP